MVIKNPDAIKCDFDRGIYDWRKHSPRKTVRKTERNCTQAQNSSNSIFC